MKTSQEMKTFSFYIELFNILNLKSDPSDSELNIIKLRDFVDDFVILTKEESQQTPTQEKLLGFASGDRVATPAELIAAFTAWDAASPKAQLFEHARSYEGRALTDRKSVV